MKEMKKTNVKLVGIVAATVVAVTVAGTFCVQSSQNRAIALKNPYILLNLTFMYRKSGVWI